jgi:hypothetical protein
MPHEVIFREQYGTLGEKIVYIKPPGRFLTFVFYINFSVAVGIMKVL